MSKVINDSESVTKFIGNLDEDFGSLIEAVRQIILGADKDVAEQIKWNSPSFFYSGEMKPFNPKEYKRDIAVMNIRKGIVMLIFPTGSSITDKSGILEGDYKDGRRIVTFKNIEDLQTKKENLQKIIKLWLNQVEKPND